MIKVSTRLLIIILGLACLILLSGTPAIADDEWGFGASVNVVTLDYITVTTDNPNATLGTTSTVQFTATASYTDGTTADATGSANWTSSNMVVATIDPNTGQATIWVAGITTISATYGGQTANTTLTVLAATGASPSGGGGGGGGGGVVGEKRITSLMTLMTHDLRLTEDVEAQSVDTKATLLIKKGTIVKNRIGSMVSSIIIETLVTPPEIPLNTAIIGRAYDIGPAGVQFFETPAKLILKYDGKSLPEGMENNLYIATWDDVNRAWDKIGGAVNPDNDSIDINLNHLSIYAIMAGTQSADLRLSDLTVNPLEAGFGKDITVSVFATNTGDLTRSFDVIFIIDNTAMKIQTITLKGQESQTVSFSMNSGSAGEHTVSVNNLSKTFRVTESSTAPLPTATASPGPSPKPAIVPGPTNVPAPTTAPKTAINPARIPVGALPVQPADNRMRIYLIGTIGSIVVISALVYLIVRPRRV